MKKSILESTYIIHKKTLILPGTQIICAFSGGQDSVLLFSILLHLKKIWNLRISVLYCQHFWQIQNIYAIEEVWKLTSLFRIPFCFFFAERPLQNESSARVWRYYKFYRSAEYFQSCTIAIGHNASDNIETAIWHIARGTSPKGLVNFKPYSKFNFQRFARTSGNRRFNTNPPLSNVILHLEQDAASDQKGQQLGQVLRKKQSINKITNSLLWNRSLKNYFVQSQPVKTPKTILLRKIKNVVRNHKYERSMKKYFYSHIVSTVEPVKIVRPLCDFHRSDITLVVNQNNLPYITDRTNKNMTFTRNRIRAEILPVLRYSINKQIDFHIYTYLQITGIQQIFLETIIRTLIESYCNTPKSIQGLLHLPMALQSQCIYEIVKTYIGRQVSIFQMENLRANME